MGIDINTYFNIKEKMPLLRQIYSEYGQDVIFIVPTGLDTETLLELICGDGAFFGDRPRVMTVGGLNAELSERSGVRKRVIDPPDHNLILKFLMDRYIKETSEKGAELPKGTSYKGFISLLGENIKDLLNEEVTPESLKASLSGGEAPKEGMPETMLLGLYERYLEYLSENCLADAAQIPTLARESLAAPAAAEFIRSKKFVFAGFLTFTGAQLRLVRTLAGMTQLLMLQPETAMEKLHDGTAQLLNFPKELKGRADTGGAVWSLPTALFAAGSPHLEFEALAREIALWADESGAFTPLGKLENYGEIGMTVQPHRTELMKYALTRYNIPFSEQIRGTAGETLLGELPGAVWEAWRSGFDHYNTHLLLSDPLLLRDGDAEMPEGVFPDNYEAWRKALGKNASDLLGRIKKFCSSLEKGGTPLEILKLWLDFIEKAGSADLGADAAADLPQLDQTVKDIYYAVYELKKKIRRLEDAKTQIGEAAGVRLYGSDAAAFIMDWGRTATLPIQLPQSRSLTLYAGQPPILASHRYLIMTDIDYNTTPGLIRESLLFRNANKIRFNESEQEKAKQTPAADAPVSHLPELGEQREQKEAVFRRITAAAEEGLIIARSLTDMSGAPAAESLFAASMITYKDRAKNAGSRIDKKKCWPELLYAEYPSDSAMPDGSSPWFPEAEISCSPLEMGAPHEIPCGRADAEQYGVKPTVNISSLDTWNNCPYLYWCRSRLGLEQPQDSLYNIMEAGTLFHKVWEECMQKKAAGEKFSLRAYAEENWERLKKENYPELADDPRLARFERIHREQLLNTASLLDDIERKAEEAGRTSVETEVDLGNYETGGVVFRAKADRIDRYGNEAVIIDYKLGRAEKHKKEMQVPAYCRILNSSDGTEIKGFGWLGHTDGKLLGVFEGRYFDIYTCPSPKQSPVSPAPRIEEASESMEAMAASVLQGVYPPKYDGKDPKCTKCTFFTLCRKREAAAFADMEEDEEGTSDE